MSFALWFWDPDPYSSTPFGPRGPRGPCYQMRSQMILTKTKYGPWNTALEDWPDGWLKLQMANLKRNPFYLVMTDDEKREAKLPVTSDEMRDYIRKKLQRK